VAAGAAECTVSVGGLGHRFSGQPQHAAAPGEGGDGLASLALLQVARVERAKHLLYSTRLSLALAQIAEAVGYTDVSSFSRLFGRWVGESPARYRTRRN
jgi:AraC-like DNA-binding protein